MAQVKVWNDNDYPHQERYKGEVLKIAPKSFIEMDYEEGLQFAGQFTPVVKRADGTDDPKHFKKIRVEKPESPVVKGDSDLICHATGKHASSKDELRALLEEFSHLRTSDPEAEKAAAAGSSAVSALQKQIEELTRTVAALQSEAASKKGPGRPKKEA